MKHCQREYARRDVQVNLSEFLFALLKHGDHRTCHCLSKHHLQRYADEIAFRWSHRNVIDGGRGVKAIKKAKGERFAYRRNTRWLSPSPPLSSCHRDNSLTS